MNILQKRINELFPEENIIVVSYSTMKEPATVKCLKCEKEYTLNKAENFLRKTKKCICKKCVNNGSGGRLSIEDFQRKIDEKYPQEKLLVTKYSLYGEECSIKCLKCNNEITLQNASSFLIKSKKRICEKCIPNKKDIIDLTKKKFLDYIKNQPFTLLTNIDDVNIQSHTPVFCKCKKCGKESSRTMSEYLRGRGCPYCANNQLLTKEQYQDFLTSEYTLLSEYKGKNNEVFLKHNLCGFSYWANARHYTCPKCAGSKGEQAISFWLDQHNIIYEREAKVDINNHQLRFDFYLPNYNYYIEYQGIQHFQSVEYFGGEETFKRQIYYDNLKKDWIKENNKKLLTINFDEDIQEALERTFSSSTTIL